MTNKRTDLDTNSRLTREVERERNERALHDEQRAGLAVDEEFRLKDARENFGSANLRRSPGRRIEM